MNEIEKKKQQSIIAMPKSTVNKSKDKNLSNRSMTRFDKKTNA